MNVLIMNEEEWKGWIMNMNWIVHKKNPNIWTNKELTLLIEEDGTCKNIKLRIVSCQMSFMILRKAFILKMSWCVWY